MLEAHPVVGGYRSVAVGPHDCARNDDLAPEQVPETHLHRADEVLVASADADRLRAALPEGWRLARVRDGTAVCRPGRLLERSPDRELPDGGPVREAVRHLREQLPDGVAVAPNVVSCSQPLRFTIAPRYQGKDDPVEPWTGPPPRGLADLGTRAPKCGVRIGVIDTGVVRSHPWLRRQAHWLDGDLEAPSADLDRSRTLIAGHGTFILGQILSRAPRARVYVMRQVDPEGVIDDEELRSAILRLERRAGGHLDLLNLSLGGWGHEDAPPVATTPVLERLYKQGTVVVAAAGNLGSNRLFWPAAMDEVVAVAASDREGRLPAWANHGPWVDAAMPATEVVSSFFDDLTWHRPGDPTPRRFRGWAKWLGSSFAAPQLVGEIAALMEREKLDARTAKDRVLAQGEPGTDRRIRNAVFVPAHDALSQTTAGGEPAEAL